MHIVLTGASGFVGSHILRHFAAQHKVIAIGRQAEPVPAMRPYLHRYVAADLSKKIPSLEADVCIHVAGLATDKAGYADLLEANTTATANVFQAVQCRQFIYISSASVYPDDRPVHTESEDININSLSDYGKTKRRAELFLLDCANTCNGITILRPRAVYGPGDRVILPRMLKFGNRGRIIAPGDLRIQLSMTHVQNLIHAIECSLALSATGGVQIFNVSDPHPYQLREVMIQLLEAVYERPFTAYALPASPMYRIAGILEGIGLHTRLTQQAIRYITRDTVLDISNIQVVLGYAPPYSFFQSIPNLVAWVKRAGLKKVLAAEASLPWVQ